MSQSTTFRCRCVPEGESSPHSDPAQCAANAKTTREYQRSMDAAGFARAEASLRKADLVASARLLGGGFVEVAGDPEWDLAPAGKDSPGTVALRSRKYRETSYGDVLFLRRGEPRYDEFLAAVGAAR